MLLSFKKTKNFFTKHERYLSPLALFVGFVFDNFTLTRIDLWFDNLILFSYLTIAGVGIALIQLYKSKVIHGFLVRKIAPLLPLLIQFAFGGLFSGYFIFFSRSASFTASWFFILLLLSLLVGNEFFRKHYKGLVFQVSIFYFALFSFTIFYIPVIVGKMGALVFLLSGFVSLVIIGALLYGFARMIPRRDKEKRKILALSISSIFLAINFLYFTNVIPPIPLSLKDSGVYHFVGQGVEGGYVVRSEAKKWYELEIGGKKIHYELGMPVYVYSSVFAPTDLNTNILHKWQYYDVSKKEWIISSKIRFPIIGGRDGGYRGYSFKESVFPGKWRVDVTTERGQVLGRIPFKIVFSEDTVALITEYK